MKCERIPLGAQGAYLDTYFLADSPELKAGACRPAVVVCPGTLSGAGRSGVLQ